MDYGKILLRNEADFNNWKEGLNLEPTEIPYEYPTVAVYEVDYYSKTVSVEYVYVEDFR